MPICEFSQIKPTPDTEPWYKERESDALKGIVYEPDLTFAPAGKFYNNRFISKAKNNVAPRLRLSTPRIIKHRFVLEPVSTMTTLVKD